jgi:hypothetical protein
MSLVNVSIDTRALSKWAEELSARGFRNALRRAIDQSARAARKITIKAIAADIGVSASAIKAATPKIVTTKAGDLSARWTVSKLRIGIMNASGATISRAGGLHASTHRVTGGGSVSLDVSKAFVINANGGRFVAFRKGKSRLPLKGIYAESPSTALGQDGSAPQKVWKDTANKEMATRLPVEIAKQFAAEGLSASTPDTSD